MYVDSNPGSDREEKAWNKVIFWREEGERLTSNYRKFNVEISQRIGSNILCLGFMPLE